MAASDFIQLNPGSGGDKLAVDVNATVGHQRVKMQFGEPGLPVDVTLTNPLPGEIVGRASGEGAKVTNGGLDVNIQDQHTRAFDLAFAQSIATPTTSSADTVAGAYTVTLTSTVGFVDGISVQLNSGAGDFFRAQQVGAPAGSVITLDTPIDKVFLSGSTVLGLSENMNVDGSVTPSTFQFGPIGTSIEVDVTRLIGYIQDATVMDDGKFGGNGILTNGVVMQKYRDATSDSDHYWNAKTNGDLALIGYDFMYTPAAPGGSYGARFRISYGGQSKHGVTIRLAASDYLTLIVHDDLTVLEEFKIMVQGHLVE